MADWIKDGVPKARTRRNAERSWSPSSPRPTKLTSAASPRGTTRTQQESLGKGSNESQSEILLRLASTAVLFHTPEDVAYASVPIDGHAENYRVQSERFRLWLTRLFIPIRTRLPRRRLCSIRPQHDRGAKALFDGPRHQVHVRGRRVSMDRHYLDLVDETWRAVGNTQPEGWQVVEKPPVVFRRTKGMLALPEPRPGGRLDPTQVVHQPRLGG